MDADQDPDDGLDPREAARDRRRDRDAAAHQRELLRPGMGKVFKQITDSWVDEASPDEARARRKAGKGHSRPR